MKRKHQTIREYNEQLKKTYKKNILESKNNKPVNILPVEQFLDSYNEEPNSLLPQEFIDEVIALAKEQDESK